MLAGHPEARTTTAAGQVDDRPPGLEQRAQASSLCERQEPDVRELLGELAAVRVLAPQAGERLAVGQRLVDRVVAGPDRVERAARDLVDARRA
jgi:hypothetical protein